MGNDPPDLGKGLFGYRKSAVNQIIADRDIMLRQAEGRVRAAEAKVAELENELSSFKDRNARMDEQLDRLRSQLDVVLKRTETGDPALAAERLPEAEPPTAPSQTDYEEGLGAGHGFPAGGRFSPEDFGYQSAEQPPASAPETQAQPRTYGWSSADDTTAVLSEPTVDPQAPAPPEDLPAWARPERSEAPRPAADFEPPGEAAGAWKAETPGQEAPGPAPDPSLHAYPRPRGRRPPHRGKRPPNSGSPQRPMKTSPLGS